MTEEYGQFVRLWGIDPSQLPPITATPHELTPFLTSILIEAVSLLADLPPASTSSSSTAQPTSATSKWQAKGVKKYASSTAPVQMYERVVTADELRKVQDFYHLTGNPNSESPASPPHPAKLQPETWFLRRSVHEDAKATGTADWEEWHKSFKQEHAEVEKKFTPSVLATEVKRQWNCEGVEVALGTEEEGKTTWVDWSLKLEQSVHKMPAPLQNRVFPVLQATAAVQGKREFIVIQIAAKKPSDEKEEGSDRSMVRGAYTSVERIQEVGERMIEWVMGTASDAAGVLPQWMQKMAVPGAVSKDVDMFLTWIAKERHQQSKNGGA